MEKLVMVVDDSLCVRTILEIALRRAGFGVVSYADGLQALEALGRHRHRDPDVIILDIGLPKLDGYHIAQVLHAKPQYHKTPIIMLTGRTGVADRLKARLAGACTYLTKPFRTEEVIGLLRDVT